MVYVNLAVEGLLDEAVARRLLQHVGAHVTTVYGRRGKGYLRQRIRSYNQAARYTSWFILVDLDQELECAPALRRQWIGSLSPRLCFRIAVHEVEAWLLADRERIARFLGVPISRVPLDPEQHLDPKQLIVQLSQKSRRRAIREQIAPRPGAGRPTGSAYATCLADYVWDQQYGWRPEVAAGVSDSLGRCVRRLYQFVTSETHQQ